MIIEYNNAQIYLSTTQLPGVFEPTEASNTTNSQLNLLMMTAGQGQ